MSMTLKNYPILAAEALFGAIRDAVRKAADGVPYKISIDANGDTVEVAIRASVSHWELAKLEEPVHAILGAEYRDGKIAGYSIDGKSS